MSRRQMVVEENLGTNLPRVPADRIQIQQVVVNLLTNGTEAMECVDGRPKAIAIRSARQGGDLLVEIRDHGTGFNTTESIFDPFVTTKPGGMGLGLAICRSIIDAHEGRIWAVAGEDVGATLGFRLPLQTSSPE